MGDSTPQHSNFAQSALVSAVTLATLILVCAVLAYWTWIWIAPRAAPHARVIDESMPRIDAAYALFGGTQRNASIATPTAPAIKVLGVVAATGGKSGYAILQLDTNKVFAVREGTDIAPGVRLEQVLSGQIIVERNGLRETLPLPEKK